MLFYLWYKIRNLFKPAEMLLHQMPDLFSALRPSGFLTRLLPREEANYLEYLFLLKTLEQSDRLKTFVYQVPEMLASWAEVEEIARRLDSLAASGRKLIAYSEGGNLKTLYLMAAAERRHASLGASFVADFPAAEPFFLKDALKKAGVRVETCAAGKYKSVFEIFTRNSFSPAARKAMEELLEELRAAIAERFKKVPGMSKPKRKKLVRTLRERLLLDASDLNALGFLQELMPESELKEFLVRGKAESLPCLHAFGDAASGADDAAFSGRNVAASSADDAASVGQATGASVGQATAASAGQATDATAASAGRATDANAAFSGQATAASVAAAEAEKFAAMASAWQARNKTAGEVEKAFSTEAALLHRHRRKNFPLVRIRSLPSLAYVALDGNIVMGRPGDPPRAEIVSALAYREVFNRLQESQEEAVFLYINSPGGSAPAVEILYQSLHRLSRIKPVFAVIGEVAASGGYYLACAANRIHGARTSITGSIGVITMHPSFEKLYKKFGVSKERVGFGPTQDIFSEAKPICARSHAMLRDHIEAGYRLFLQRVSRGRNKSEQQVEELAAGRVWTGESFLKHGMLDRQMDILAAMEDYKISVGYGKKQEFQVFFYPQIKTDLREIAHQFQIGPFFRARQKCRIGSPEDVAQELYRLYLQFATTGDAPALHYLPVKFALRGIL